MSDNDDDDIDFREAKKGRKNLKEIDWISVNQAKRLIVEQVKDQHEKLFRDIGYDITEYKEIRILREDLLFLRSLRESSQERKSTLLKGLITSLIGAIIGLLTAAFTWLIAHKTS